MKILLIEDNSTIIKGLKYALEKEKYEFEYKSFLRDARKYLEDGAEVDLVILDVSLPDGNGFDIYKDIISKHNIPTIFLTAKDEEDDIVKGLELGAEDYITKPFSTKEWLARINRTLMRYKKQSIKTVQDIKKRLPQKTASFYVDRRSFIVCRMGLKISIHRDER